MADFGRFRGVFGGIGGVLLFMKFVVPTEPEGANILVDRRERDVDAVLSSCCVRFAVFNRF